jgi:hypothetical protein
MVPPNARTAPITPAAVAVESSTHHLNMDTRRCAPAFVRSDGPLYGDGPIWRMELANPAAWPGHGTLIADPSGGKGRRPIGGTCAACLPIALVTISDGSTAAEVLVNGRCSRLKVSSGDGLLPR